MNTHPKNKSAHPARPIMTPAQLSAAGIPLPKSKRPKKQTKDQQIAALREDLRLVQEMARTDRPSSARNGAGLARAELPADDYDMEVATENDDDESAPVIGRKRAAQGPVSTGTKVKRSRAMDPFESEKIHTGTTGLVDNWRSKLAASPSAISQIAPERSLTLSSSSLVMQTPTSSSMEDDRPVYMLPWHNAERQKVYPGVKQLPTHIRTDFRNTFIRVIIRSVFNSETPWANPDVPSFQLAYDEIHPTYPARIRANDAVHHSTVTALALLRSRIGTASVFVVQRHLTNLYRQKRLKTLDARAKLVSEQFKFDDDHPFIWREYTVGNIENHPEIGGYQMTRRGVFQCEPILEMLLAYYSSFGIREPAPLEDPGEENRPIGALAMVTAAVERAFKMHLTGDYIDSTQSFNAEFWSGRTTLFMDYIANDLTERNWDGIFRGLAAVSNKVPDEVAIQVGALTAEKTRVPLPALDPPSPPAA